MLTPTWKCLGAFLVSAILSPSVYAGMVASYTFNNTLAALQFGVAPLVAVDPLSTSGYQSATVFGNTQTVWHFDGDSSGANQGGLTLDTTGLVSANDYSVEMVLSLANRDHAWRRLLDSLDRQSDAGFYVSPNNDLEVFPQGGASSAFAPNTFYDIVLTVDSSNTVSGYFGGTQQFTLNSANMIIASHTLGFFIDNVIGGGQGEWSAGNIALVKIWNSALTAQEVATEHDNPFQGTDTPEPSAWILAASGAAAIFARARRKQ